MARWIKQNIWKYDKRNEDELLTKNLKAYRIREILARESEDIGVQEDIQVSSREVKVVLEELTIVDG